MDYYAIQYHLWQMAGDSNIIFVDGVLCCNGAILDMTAIEDYYDIYLGVCDICQDQGATRHCEICGVLLCPYCNEEHREECKKENEESETA